MTIAVVESYRVAGARVDAGAFDGADVVLSVQPLAPQQVRKLRPGAITISFLPVAHELDLVRALRDAGHTAFALATLRRLGAVVRAYDVRAAAAEERSRLQRELLEAKES